jgi:DNA modification methylase
MFAVGNAVRIPLAAGSIHTVVTSPPYWPQRRYEGNQVLAWPGVEYRTLGGTVRLAGDPDCPHRWQGETHAARGDGRHRDGQGDSGLSPERRDEDPDGAVGSATCALCGAWRGALGLEPSIEMYVGHLVAVAREVRRVLHPAGTFWLNLGDAYVNPKKWGGQSGAKNYTSAAAGCAGQRRRFDAGLPPKSLAGIPWRVAFALQADGWTLRRDHVWAKGVSFAREGAGRIVRAWAAARGLDGPAADELLALLEGQLYTGNAMPESAVDRATTAHEYVFLFTRSPHYYYNLAAGQEARAYPPSRDGRNPRAGRQAQRNAASGGSDGRGASTLHSGDPRRRRIRSVWTIPTVPGRARPRCVECDTPWDLTPLRMHRARQALGADFRPPARGAARRGGKRGDGPGTPPLFDGAVSPAAEPVNLTAYLETVEDEHGLGDRPLTCPRCGGEVDDLAHFAAFPPELPRRCIEIGCPARVCAACGTPWEEGGVACDCEAPFGRAYDSPFDGDHDTPFGEAHDKPARPGWVLDPFAGTGTTVRVALALGRRAVGLDLSEQYLRRIARARTAAVQQEMF